MTAYLEAADRHLLGRTDRERLIPPFMEKQIVVEPPHYERLNPDGSLNTQFTVKGPAVYYHPLTGESVMLFQGSEPDDIPPGNIGHSAIYAVRSTDDWQTSIFFGKENPVINDRTIVAPVLVSTDPERLAPSGQKHPRITVLEQGTDREACIIVVNSADKQAIQISKIRAGDDKTQPLKGSTPEAYILKDPSNPDSYIPLGPIGPPDEFFKNVMIHPKLIMKDGTSHILMICRKLPGIQGFLIPYDDFFQLPQDIEFRRRYWQEQFQSENIEKCTILNPIFPWEAKGDPNYPEGQISGGAPPIEIDYKDPISGELKKAWLFAYNAVSSFDENMRSHGRVVGIALLDYQNPYHVIARSPMPIITPTEPVELDQGSYPNSTFVHGGYVDKKGVLRLFYSAGDKVITMAHCSLQEMVGYLTRFDSNGNRRI